MAHHPNYHHSKMPKNTASLHRQTGMMLPWLPRGHQDTQMCGATAAYHLATAPTMGICLGEYLMIQRVRPRYLTGKYVRSHHESCM